MSDPDGIPLAEAVATVAAEWATAPMSALQLAARFAERLRAGALNGHRECPPDDPTCAARRIPVGVSFADLDGLPTAEEVEAWRVRLTAPALLAEAARRQCAPVDPVGMGPDDFYCEAADLLGPPPERKP